MLAYKSAATLAVVALCVPKGRKPSDVWKCHKRMKRGVKTLESGRFGRPGESIALLQAVCRACNRCEGV